VGRSEDMAILNFDYKLNAWIQPIQHKYFTYNIYAEVQYSGGNILYENVYEGNGHITTPNITLDTAKVQSDSNVATLAKDKIDTLKAEDPNMQILRYVVLSQNPYIFMTCAEDGSDYPVAWSEEVTEDEVWIETNWMNGPQIDTDIYNSEDHQLMICSDISSVLIRNATTDLPDEFQIVSLEAISNNEQVCLTYNGTIQGFGTDMKYEKVLSVSADTTSLTITKNKEQVIHLDIEVDNANGIDEQMIDCRFTVDGVAQVVSKSSKEIIVKGLEEGTTDLIIGYHSNLINPISVQVVKPIPKMNLTKDHEHSFVGDPTELHFLMEYDNGDRFTIQSSSLEVTKGEASIEKIDEATYKVIPNTTENVNLLLHVTSTEDEKVDMNVILPVWNKKLYRFHVLPDNATIAKGQEITLEAFYNLLYSDMQHDDNEITWEIVEGNEFGFLQQINGKSVTLSATGQGTILVKASIYDNESIVPITIAGDTEKILHLSDSLVQLAPGEQKTIYAQMINGDTSNLIWDIQDNGLIKILKQTNSYIAIEGLINGQATITAKCDQLEQQVTITVSEDLLSDVNMMSETNTSPSYPMEDNEEQWALLPPPAPYVDGKGTSTILYGTAQGSSDETYAFHSGIGDNDDLFVKKPQAEDIAQSFQYAARLRGRKKHQIMIYPEIDFQYTIQYKGDLYYDYNESPFKVGIDAYPAKPFNFTIVENRRLETKRDYEVRMDIGGNVPITTVDYAVDWSVEYPVKYEGDVKDLFTSDKGTFIGAGDRSVWINHGSYIADASNQSYFSGILAKEYMTWGSYEAEFDFKTIGSMRDYNSLGTDQDDDLIGLIFKAKDNKNFYLFLWEAEERVKGSWRAGDLNGFNVLTQTWDAHCVASHLSWSDSKWQSYCNNSGWGRQHRRVYKVTNGVLSRVYTQELGDGRGWDYKSMSSMKVRSVGSKVTLYVRHSLSSGYEKVFEFDTKVETGGFGACNISQAVEFHSIRVTKWNKASGRVPASGWNHWKGIGSTIISTNVDNYVASSVASKIGSEVDYEVTSANVEIHDATTGTGSTSPGKPLVIKSFNPPNAGQLMVQSFTIKNTVTVTPDNINPSTGLVAFENIEDLFKQEVAKFKKNFPTLINITPLYSLVSPNPGDPQYQFDGKKLVFWEGEAPTDTMSKDYTITAYAYQGWIERDLSEFRGGKWANYTVTFHDNTFTVNPKYDQWQWKKAGAVNFTDDDTDVLMIRTTEWYEGTFPADIHNEGIVTSNKPVYVDTPPNHEHYVDPNDKTPMPPIFENVDYLLRKYDVGNSKFVWMYWEGTPGITTKNTTAPINAINGQPVIKTDRQNDRVVVKCDPNPRYIPWTSGRYTGYGKVNGKRPFFGPSAGKANMINVPTNVVYLPDNLINIQGPLIEVDDDRVQVSVDSINKMATFSSDWQDAYIWYTQWYSDWTEDPRSFFADVSDVTLIEDTIEVDPYLSPDYDENVQIDGIEVTSNNPFVSVWTENRKGKDHGLLATYYKFPQQIRYIKQGFVVDGDYHIKSQTFHINEAQSEIKVDGKPAADTFMAGEAPVRGIIPAKTSEEVKTVYVSEGQPVLKIVGSFFNESGIHYPDLAVIAPNGESFGIAYNNGTWNANAITLTNFQDGSPILCAKSYQFSGENQHDEIMTFTQPIAGTWKIRVFNQGIQDAAYAVSTNISKSAIHDFKLSVYPDPWSLKISVNGNPVSTCDKSWTVLEDGTLHTTAALTPDDLIHVDYTSGGSYTASLPMQSEFQIFESQDIKVLSVTKNNVNIPMSTTNGYEIVDKKTFKIHGSYLTPGNIVMKYSIGELNNTFTLKETPASNVTVYLNGNPIDSSKYVISGNTLTVDRSLLQQKDWIHIQSYQAIDGFDPKKVNYLGNVKFQRIDPTINFDWGDGSPLTNPVATAEVEPAEIKIEEVLPDQLTFNYDVEMQITYPDNEPIDLSNFTGVWVKWDENVGTDVGDWHGPPENEYTKITNLANQSYRSGWYNPYHVNFTDYTFTMKVQEINSGDDDMYGCMFRFNPDTFNFYSVEMDAYLSRTAQQGDGPWGTGVKGTALYRNICTNPSQYGSARLTYKKVQLAHLNEGWTYGASEENSIQVKLTGRRIQVFINNILKFDIVDDSPDALLQGAWGPVTMSQPKTYFWDLSITRYKTATVQDYPSFQKNFYLTVNRPVDDITRIMEIPVDDNQIEDEFQAAINQFLMDHPDLTKYDLMNQYSIVNDQSPYKVFFNNNHVVKILELTPSRLKPNPLGKTFIQQAVEKYGNFNQYEKISVTQDIYENWSKYNVDDFDVLTFTPCDCNAQTDLIDSNMMDFVRKFKQEGKVIIFTHDTAGLPNFRTLEVEFGFTYAPTSKYTRHSTVMPLQHEDWMKYPYDLDRVLNITPTHINSIPTGGGGYAFVDEPNLQWIKHVGNVFYSEIGDHHYDCSGNFVMQPTDDEMMVWINLMMRVAVWRNQTSHETITNNNQAKVYAEVLTMPATAPSIPSYGDLNISMPTYDPQNSPVEIFPSDKSEPFIAPLVPKDDENLMDGFAINWSGKIYAPFSGVYEFTSTSDDGFKLWVNDVLIIDAWQIQTAPFSRKGTIQLEGGKWYSISANYFESTGNASVKLEWKVPGKVKEVIPSEYLTPSLGYSVAAQVKEVTPRPWNPMIHNGYYYFQEHEHVLFAEKIHLVQTPVGNQLLISPRPQQGAAIIVRDNEGNNLRKVSFFEKMFDENGNLMSVTPTLENIESFNGNGYSKYYLAYSAIDEDTLQVSLNGVTLTKDLYLFDAKNSSITFMKNIHFDDIMEFRYKLLYSYYVDYNYDIQNDVARIVLHDNYDPSKMKDMEIIYEGAKDTPFYRAEEVSFNPILNHNHRGFLYLTNKVDDYAKSVSIHVSPSHVPAKTFNKVLITGQVLDKYDNPIQNKKVTIYRDGETVFVGQTNRAGEVYFYDQPSMHGSHVMIYEILCDGLKNRKELHFYEPDIKNRYYLEMKTDKTVLTAGSDDKATITITLRDENWSVVAGETISVSYTDTKGNKTSKQLTTNGFGQASITLSGIDQKQGVFVTDSVFSLKGEEISSFLYLKVIGG